MPSNDDVPLTLIAAELSVAADTLAIRLDSHVITNDIGIRCISPDLARSVIADHRAALQARRDQVAAARDEARRRPHPTRDRVRALRAVQDGTGLLLDGPIQPGAALESMKITDGSREEKLDASAARFAELTTGAMPYHKISQKG